MAFSDKATAAEPLLQKFSLHQSRASLSLALSVCHLKQTFFDSIGNSVRLTRRKSLPESGLIFDGKKLIFVIAKRESERNLKC
jgi:hypothetical protein